MNDRLRTAHGLLALWTSLTPRAAAEEVAEALDGVARSTTLVLAEKCRRYARAQEGVVRPVSDVLNDLAAELEGKTHG